MPPAGSVPRSQCSVSLKSAKVILNERLATECFCIQMMRLITNATNRRIPRMLLASFGGIRDIRGIRNIRDRNCQVARMNVKSL